MTEDNAKHQQLVSTIVDTASPAEREAISSWAVKLLEIRASDTTTAQKAKAAIGLTLASKVVWTAVKIAAKNTKKVGWDDRSRSARLGIGASAVGVALFGGQNAGIAALGTAIGVPLWVVLGAGAAFANQLLEEIARRSKTPDATYRILDAEPVDPKDK